MFNLFLLSLIVFIISMLMYIINFILMKKTHTNREKLIPLECGFNFMNKKLLPFSIQFYYMSILFLIFDIEISILLPMIQKIYFFMINKWIMSFSIIITILILGLYIEWWNNLIKWK
uniref:NADH-ubiquinone oxidoreductase chain 3 n=1 Tax=Ceratobaeus sp. MM-2013 TaxID=1429432 RepID=A0A067YFQ8_9HYME|nr:NADH dehydrogenase subunit 3 [Ceratobaeus sp. MM-2013]